MENLQTWERRAGHFRVFGYYLVAACLDSTIGYIEEPSSANPVAMDEARTLLPAIMAVGSFFCATHHQRTFDLGFHLMIDEIEREVHGVARSLSKLI